MSDYKDSRSLEQAVKAAAQRTGRPIQKAQEEYWRSRLLARFFSSVDLLFVLKGGASILARIPDARRTRDLDLFIQSFDEDTAINELIELASADLGDFCRFQLLSQEPIQEDASYRNGYKLKFQM
jgi:hypothetical protein